MKIRKNYWTFLMAAAVIIGLSGCNKKDDPKPKPSPTSAPSELVGTWKQTEFNGHSILTAETKIFEFITLPDDESGYPGNMMMAEKAENSNAEPIWQEIHTRYSYNNEDQTISVVGTFNPSSTQFTYKYKIVEITDTKLEMILLEKFINNRYLYDETIDKSITFENVAINTSGKIAKMWKEKYRNGVAETKFGYYFNLNTFDYYYYENGQSQIKNDHQGGYWFYDSFLVMRYFNDPDILDGMFHLDCWEVEFELKNNEETMTLRSTGEGGVRETYILTR